ncbi:MAG: hypothetical protein IJ859_13200 [Synergistaceae bacterium]|nr:hypothetical protein [Synergistaceae bacterium]
MYLLTTREFHNVSVDFYVDEQNNFWITREQIGLMLNYRCPERSIKKIHEFFSRHFAKKFKEIRVNTRRKGLIKTVLYNFEGLIELCSFSDKERAKDAINFLWQAKRDFEHGSNLPALPGSNQALLPFAYGDKKVRAVKQNGEFWFIAKDICDILDIKNSRDALNALDDDEKMTVGNSDSQKNRGGAQFFNVINEPGIYHLIFRSNKADAKRFKHWIFHEVLPTLRKTGSYSFGKFKKPLPETCFYSAEEIAIEAGLSENEIIKTASENCLFIYGFTDDCMWFFTEEGRRKILDAARL